MDQGADEGRPMLVTFSLDVQSQSGTRAYDENQWGGEYPSLVGTDFENKIDLSTLMVFVYDTNGNFVTDLPILLCEEDENKVAHLTCAFPKSMNYVVGTSYRFMVIANCTSKNYGISYNGNMPNLAGLVFPTPLKGSIPMWGVYTKELTELPANNRVLDLGSVSMLRAVAKIGIKLSEDVAKEYSLVDIKLNYANPNGYCLPEHWNKTATTELLEHDEVFRPNTDADLVTDINAKTSSLVTGAYYMYVPETANNAAPNDLSIAVTLKKDGELIEFPYENGIRFCKYENGQPTDENFNIVRNHFYDYTITEVSVGLKMNLVVAEWEDEPVWDLEFSAPIHSKLLPALPDENGDIAAPTQVPSVYYDAVGNDSNAVFEGYFKMDSPQGVTWRPTLANASKTDYKLEVYKTNGTDPDYNILVEDEAIEAEQDYYYKIVVKALDPDLVDNVIKLGITYTASWNQDANPLLLINKGDSDANNGLYYPWDGTDSNDAPDIHWISIRQVATDPIHSKLLPALPDENGDVAAPAQVPSVYYDADGNDSNAVFEGYFKMDSPQGVTWRPTLANASKTDYKLEVYKTNGTDPDYNILVEDEAIEAEKDYYYKIVVKALKPDLIDNVIKLGITYTASWNQDANPLLLINKGSDSSVNNGLYYPWDGTEEGDAPDIHWISIRQVVTPASANNDEINE